MLEFRPAQAYWNRRYELAKSCGRILQLRDAVGRGSDLLPSQWAQLMAVAMEFEPDLILELGRAWGNSTAAFTQASYLMGGGIRVVSLCNSTDWEKRTLPQIRPLVSEEWLAPLTTLTADILSFDYAEALKDAKRVLVFWDAHGFDIAECVLATILPLLAGRPHLIIMHDLSDARYGGSDAADYGEQGIWKGVNNWSGPRVRLGIIDSAVEQAVAAVDFASRNQLTLDSADHSFHTELSDAQAEEMQTLLGPLFDRCAHWFYFSLNERPGPYRFPVVRQKLDVVIPMDRRSGGLLDTLSALDSSLQTYRSVLLCCAPGSRGALSALQGRQFDNLNIVVIECGGADSHAPVVAGLRASAAMAVVVLPPDGAKNVRDIGAMAAMVHSGYALVAGNRLTQADPECTWGDALLARIAAFPLRHIARLPVRDPTNVFRIYSRRAIDEIAIESSRGFGYNIEILAKCHRAGLKVGEVSVTCAGRQILKRMLTPSDWSLGYVRWLFYALATTYLGRRVNTGGASRKSGAIQH
jgi:cephalosporin hydroxylase